MLTCMNSKKEFYHLNYQMTGKYLTCKTTFSKKANLMKYPVQTYVLMRTWNLLFVYFPSVSHQTMKSILNTKKKHITLSNLIKVISYYNICSGIKDDQAKKTAICHSVPKTFDFSQNFSVPFHGPFNFMRAFNR